MHRHPPKWIVRELKLIDPSFELLWRECRSPNGVDHNPCRRDFDLRPICDRWVLYRRIDPSVDERRVIAYFGRDWKGPYPDRIRILEIPPREELLYLLPKVVRRGYVRAQDRESIRQEIERMQQRQDEQKREIASRFQQQMSEGFARALRDGVVRW